MSTTDEVTTAAVRMRPHLKRLALVMTHIGVAAASAVITMKRLEQRYADLAKLEIAEARDYYEEKILEVPIVPQYNTPGEAVQALIGEGPQLDHAVKALAVYQGVTPGDTVVETSVTLTEVAQNVFTDAEPKALEIDKEHRDPEKPYVITEDEYVTGEFEYQQVNLTYYLGDETLAAEDDSVIDNVDYTVGSENLKRFGEGSGDPHVVFVRNVKLQLDYEIAQSFGKYAVEVAGLDDETLQHSYSRTPRRRHHLTDD